MILESSFKSSLPETIKISKPKNDVEILCDSKQLEVVFSNIITNSVQAIEKDGEIIVRPCLKLSLSVDHRLIDGAVAARFLARIKELVETCS